MFIIILLIIVCIVTLVTVIYTVRQRNKYKKFYHTEDEKIVTKITDVIQDALNHINKENKKE